MTTVDTTPSSTARTGQLSSGAVSVDPRVAAFLAAFYPLPNAGLLGSGDTGRYAFAAQQVTTENYFTLRLDQKLSGKDFFSGTYMRDKSQTLQPGTFG